MTKKLGGSQGIKPNKLNNEVGSGADKSFNQKMAGGAFLKK